MSPYYFDAFEQFLQRFVSLLVPSVSCRVCFFAKRGSGKSNPRIELQAFSICIYAYAPGLLLMMDSNDASLIRMALKKSVTRNPSGDSAVTLHFLTPVKVEDRKTSICAIRRQSIPV
jgi:hypothetical protein